MFMRHLSLAAAALLGCLPPSLFAAEIPGAPGKAGTINALKVSDNHHYLVDAATGNPVFILADTAWNLGALKIEEIDTYLQSRTDHGFNTIMFALSFAPQAQENNAYGQPAYLGADKTELNPAYFETCDAIIRHAAARGLYAMLYTMWGGEKAGTMNHYTPTQLTTLGRALGRRYAGQHYPRPKTDRGSVAPAEVSASAR